MYVCPVAEDVEPPGGELPNCEPPDGELSDGEPPEAVLLCSCVLSTNQLDGNVSCDPIRFGDPTDRPFDADVCGFDPAGNGDSDNDNNHGGTVESI